MKNIWALCGRNWRYFYHVKTTVSDDGTIVDHALPQKKLTSSETPSKQTLKGETKSLNYSINFYISFCQINRI